MSEYADARYCRCQSRQKQASLLQPEYDGSSYSPAGTFAGQSFESELISPKQLNTEADKNDEHHLLRMLDSFIHHNHLCLVFECLSSNLYELIKHNQFRGLSLQLVKMFTAQLLDALSVLKDHRLIHCDLKPENILLKR